MSFRYSVVVTNYNYGRYLRECLESVAAQTLPPVQVIVVDDGSTDDSREVLQQFSMPGLEIVLQPNRGQLAAFRAGIARLATDHLLLLDADDLWLPGYAESVSQIYASDASIDFVFSNLEMFGVSKGRFFTQTADKDWGLLANHTRHSGRFVGAPTSALAMRRHIAEACLLLPPQHDNYWRAQADVCLVLAADLHFAHKYFQAAALVRYRHHGGNAWLGDARASSVRGLQRRLARRALVEFHATHSGLAQPRLELVEAEYRLRRLDAHEMAIYRAILLAMPLRLPRKLISLARLMRHYWFPPTAPLQKPHTS